MNNKLKISLLIILILIINSICFLYQIDKHEKALIGHAWLNNVPSDKWKAFLFEESQYNEKIRRYQNDNKDLIALIQKYDKQGNVESYFTLPPHITLDNFSLWKFKKDNPEAFRVWQSIYSDVLISRPIEPKPSNPPKQVINQQISSLYRMLVITDMSAILILCVFVGLYKNKEILPQIKKNPESD